MSTSTQKRPIHAIDLHLDHQEWLNALKFYKEELAIFEKRLEHIVKHNTGGDVLAQLEHFQNQFIRQNEVIDELRHDLKAHENHLEKQAVEHPIAFDHARYTDHTELRDRFNTFEKLYKELKLEFRNWLAARM